MYSAQILAMTGHTAHKEEWKLRDSSPPFPTSADSTGRKKHWKLPASILLYNYSLFNGNVSFPRQRGPLLVRVLSSSRAYYAAGQKFSSQAHPSLSVSSFTLLQQWPWIQFHSDLVHHSVRMASDHTVATMALYHTCIWSTVGFIIPFVALLRSSFVMWHKKYLWNFSVLLGVHISNFVSLCVQDTVSC